MIYPNNFEHKIGFSEVRTLLKGRCMSTLGTEWVDNQVKFSNKFELVKESLEQAREFALFRMTEEEVYEENFYDVRQQLLRIRPERTYLEELDLFDLKRSLQTVVSLVQFFRPRGEGADAVSENGASQTEDAEVSSEVVYPALARMTEGVSAFPQIIKRIDLVLNKYGKVKDTATPELLNIRHSIEVTSRNISHSLRSIINEAQAEGYIDRDVSPTLRDGRLVIPVAPALKRKFAFCKSFLPRFVRTSATFCTRCSFWRILIIFVLWRSSPNSLSRWYLVCRKLLASNGCKRVTPSCNRVWNATAKR